MLPIDLQIIKYLLMEKPIYHFKMKPYFQTEPYQLLVDYMNNLSEGELSDNLNEREYTVFDLETTGFLPEIGHEILTIGAVRINKKGEITDQMHQLIKPIRPVPKHILSLTNLQRSELEAAPSFIDGFQRFLTFSNRSTLVAHPAHFDVHFLKAMVKRWKLPAYSPSCIDSQLMARLVVPHVSHRLDPLLDHFNIHTLKRHHALNDALMTARLFRKLLALSQEEHEIFTYSHLQNQLEKQKS